MTAFPSGGRADRDLIDKALNKTRDGIALRVRLRPGASANRIEGLQVLDDGQTVLQVRVTAVAEKGPSQQSPHRTAGQGFQAGQIGYCDYRRRDRPPENPLSRRPAGGNRDQDPGGPKRCRPMTPKMLQPCPRTLT